jgi:Ulp1 family protease
VVYNSLDSYAAV